MFRKLITEETCKCRFEMKWHMIIRTYKLEKNKFMTRLFRFGKDGLSHTSWAYSVQA